MAKEQGIDLSTVKGTGPNARITKVDIELAAKAPKKVAPVVAAAVATKGAPMAAPQIILTPPQDG